MQPVNNLLISGLSPVTVGGASTSVLYFPAVPGASIGVASANNGLLAVPGSGRANGQQLTVRATGNATLPGADASSPAFTVGLYAVINPAIVSNAMNLPASSSVVTLGTTQHAAAGLGIQPFPWRLTADISADTLSGILQGTFSTQIDGTYTASAAISSQSGINMSNTIPFALLIGVTFSQTGTGNTASMYEFVLEQ